MSAQSFIFEQPLNERIRTLLRIEAMIERLDYFKSLDHDTASHHAILAILEITSLVERGDIKQEIIKELERQHKVLTALVSHEGIDRSRLELTLSKIKNALNSIHGLDGKLGAHLKRIDFLLTIKQRASIPGGSCDFDLPQLRYWLNLSQQSRLRDLNNWAQQYYQIHEVLVLALKIIRDSGHPETIVARQGFFQENLDPSHPNQLLRIEIPRHSAFFPEISAGKHRYSVRFLHFTQSVDQIPVQYKEDVEFKLYRCSL
jgi:cell division protein ZapD